MTNQGFFARLDTMVEWTGIPALAKGTPKRRPLHWPATLALALAFGGYGFSVVHVMGFPAASLGYGIEMLGFAIGCFVQIWGPLKPFGGMERADEWDRAVRARAYLVTFAVFAVTTMIALALMMAALAFDYPREAVMQGGAQTLFLLFAILNAMPTAHASWSVRWQRDGDQAD